VNSEKAEKLEGDHTINFELETWNLKLFRLGYAVAHNKDGSNP